MNNLMHDIYDTAEYIRGKNAAKDGYPAEVGASVDYDMGYGEQYSAEQELCAMGITQNKKMSIFG